MHRRPPGPTLFPYTTLFRSRGEQLVATLRSAVVQGRLTPGTRLPSTRDLAADLSVSRGLVLAAYEQLTAEGRLVAVRGSGTVVAAPTVGVVDPPARATPPRPDGVLPLRPGVPDLAL